MAGDETAATREPLEYAQKAPRLTPQRVRAFVLLALAAAFIAGCFLWGDRAQSAFLEWQRRRRFDALEAACVAYQPRDGQVVYEEDPARAASLAEDTGYHPVGVTAVAQSNTEWPATNPTRAALPVVHVPVTWAKYWQFEQPGPPGSTPGLAFMHERTIAGGRRMLVVVTSAMEMRRPPTAFEEEPRWGMLRALCAWSTEPGRGQMPDSRPPSGMLYIEGLDEREGVTLFSDDPAAPMLAPFPMRLYAGRIDPNDASRFTTTTNCSASATAARSRAC